MRAAGGLSIISSDDLTLSEDSSAFPTEMQSDGGNVTLAAVGGTFINNAGDDLFSGNEDRIRIYSETDAGVYNDGGIAGFEEFIAAYDADRNPAKTG